MHKILPLLVVAALCACEDSSSIAGPKDTPVAPPPMARATCTVDVPSQTMSCSDALTTSNIVAGVKKDILIGGQDVFVKLSSFGTSYDTGTEIFSSNVIVQSLIQHYLGTSDGTTVEGVKVFFAIAPTTTLGTGMVTVANADGVDTFTGAGQPYFNYAQIITPMELSSAKSWQFNVPAGVQTFTFGVLISANVSGSSSALLGPIWTGNTDTDWNTTGNWKDGVVPGSTSTVQVPPDSLVAAPNMPVLGSDVTIANLRVGFGSTLDLAGFTATVTGNADATGSVSNGRILVTGASGMSHVGGSFNALSISGPAQLQRATTTSGAVTISDGSLSVKDQTLNISIQ